jgi:aminoglycoside phosphotransferase family enzyme
MTMLYRAALIAEPFEAGSQPSARDKYIAFDLYFQRFMQQRGQILTDRAQRDRVLDPHGPFDRFSLQPKHNP